MASRSSRMAPRVARSARRSKGTLRSTVDSFRFGTRGGTHASRAHRVPYLRRATAPPSEGTSLRSSASVVQYGAFARCRCGTCPMPSLPWRQCQRHRGPKANANLKSSANSTVRANAKTSRAVPTAPWPTVERLRGANAAPAPCLSPLGSSASSTVAPGPTPTSRAVPAAPLALLWSVCVMPMLHLPRAIAHLREQCR